MKMDNNSKIEEWRPIQGYEELYEVSSEGRIRSLSRIVKCRNGVRFHKGRVLKPEKVRSGYLQVCLNKDGKQKLFSVHLLVWESFNGKSPEGMEINHIDEDKSNNSLENLNLMTHKENVNWGTGNERRSTNHINHKSLSKAVVQYDIQGNLIAEYPSQHEAERKLGIAQTSICSALNGRLKTAGGFKWKYKTA